LKRMLAIESEAIQCKEPLIAFYLGMLEACRRDTKASINGMNAELLYWREADKDSSIGDLLYHIALVEADWLFTDILQEPIPEHIANDLSHEDRDNLGRLIHIGQETAVALLSRLDAVRSELKTSYSTMDCADFRRLRHLPRYDVSPEWVLHHLLQHEAEHRGQINLLKRKAIEANTSP
jgi:uncharacterized damage-inducible protein DinB